MNRENIPQMPYISQIEVISQPNICFFNLFLSGTNGRINLLLVWLFSIWAYFYINEGKLLFMVIGLHQITESTEAVLLAKLLRT